MKSGSLDWKAAREALELGRQHLEEAALPEAARERILRRRAEMLAHPAAPLGVASQGDATMVFRIGGGRYGVALSQVVEVLRGVPLTPVPGAPAEVAGAFQVRGEIRPAFRLTAMMGLAEGEFRDVAIIVLLRHGRRELGICADEVEDIRPVEEESRRPAPSGSSHCGWMTTDLVAVLNLDSLFEGKV